MFQCDKCGLCCQQVGQSELYAWLDRGDGVCKYYDEQTKLCSRYDTRPLICNVDKAYQEYFKDEMSLEEYYMLNYKACQILKEKHREEFKCI